MLMVHKDTLNEVNVATPLISNILVPVNFSRRSAASASFALRLARDCHASVTLLHVEKPVQGDAFWTRETARWAKQEMARFCLQSGISTSVRRIISLDPDIAGEILRTSVDIGADLIVMPTHGFGMIRRVLLGSVTASVLRGATCPVWTSSHSGLETDTRYGKPQRILCAINSVTEDSGSVTKDSKILLWASQLALELNANLYVAWDPEAGSETREEVDRLEREYRISAEMVTVQGDVSEALHRAAIEMRADLLVVSRNFERSPEESELDMYQVVRASPCPVVSM